MGETVRVTDLAVVFSGASVIDGVTFEVKAASSLALVGPSGSGKSTVLNCLSGLQVPSAGTVEVGDLRISSLDGPARARFRRERVGLMFQQPELLPELSVLENIALVSIFDGEPRRRALERARADLEEIGLDGLADRGVHQLSGGEAQRVSLVRALSRSGVDLVVADEPTASLDSVNVVSMVRLLIDFATARQVTLVVATHDDRVSERMDARLDLATTLLGSPS